MLRYLRRKKNLGDIPANIEQQLRIRSTYYDIFPHSGILLFCGSQGTGKSVSAVHYVRNLIEDFPRLRIVTNMDVCFMGYPNEVVRYTDSDDLVKYGSNGDDGVLFLLDEIHLIWNSLESKSVTPADMIEFAQSRKQRRLIVGTAQRVTRIAKPVREQLKYVVDCHNFFGFLQLNTLIDMEECIESVDGTIEINNGRLVWYVHDYLLRNTAFDTYQKMKRIGGKQWRKG